MEWLIIPIDELIFFRGVGLNHQPVLVLFIIMENPPIFQLGKSTNFLWFIILITIAGWWFQPLWKILINGKDYPIY